MTMTVEESCLPVTLTVGPLTNAEFRDWCDRYPDYSLETTSDGELIIMPPTDPETGARNAYIIRALANWAESVRRGVVTESSSGFELANGARRSPDAAWMSRSRYQKRPACPEFIIELVSPFDRPKKVREKMVEWLENGAELGWMIDPIKRTVSIYRTGQNVEVCSNIQEIEGDGPVAGFVLDLRNVWDVALYD
jgi:Uma2 family endonuclease